MLLDAVARFVGPGFLTLPERRREQRHLQLGTTCELPSTRDPHRLP